MPSAGKLVRPVASIFRMMSKRRDETSRPGSSWMPAKSGCQNWATNAGDSRARRRREAVVVSVRRSSLGADKVTTPATRAAVRSLSVSVPTGEHRVAGSCHGRRRGSLSA